MYYNYIVILYIDTHMLAWSISHCTCHVHVIEPSTTTAAACKYTACMCWNFYEVKVHVYTLVLYNAMIACAHSCTYRHTFQLHLDSLILFSCFSGALFSHLQISLKICIKKIKIKNKKDAQKLPYTTWCYYVFLMYYDKIHRE